MSKNYYKLHSINQAKAEEEKTQFTFRSGLLFTFFQFTKLFIQNGSSQARLKEFFQRQTFDKAEVAEVELQMFQSLDRNCINFSLFPCSKERLVCHQTAEVELVSLQSSAPLKESFPFRHNFHEMKLSCQLAGVEGKQ